MASPVNPGQGAQVPVVNNAAGAGPDAVTAGTLAQTHGGGATTKTMIGSLGDLKSKAPELYQKMLEGIAMSICRDMKEHQDRLKKLMREATDGR